MKVGRQKIRVGEMMMWFRRYVSYIQMILFGVNTLAAIKILAVSYWWLLLLVPVSVMLILGDVLIIGPGEFQSATNRNPEWERFIREDVKAIKKALKI